MPSSIPSGHRRLAAVAGLVLAVGLALTGCDPTATGGVRPAGSASSGAATPTPSSTPAVDTAGPTPSPTPPATVTPTEAPTVAAGASVAPPVAPAATVPAAKPAPTKAAPTKAPAPAPKVSSQPAAPPRTSAAPAPAGGCEIVSNAGNCYKAGQFCRNADLGRSTHDADGRMIYCRMVSGKPHWQA